MAGASWSGVGWALAAAMALSPACSHPERPHPDATVRPAASAPASSAVQTARQREAEASRIEQLAELGNTAQHSDWFEVPELEPAPPGSVPRLRHATDEQCFKRHVDVLGAAALERQVQHGDACAATALVDKLLDKRPLPAGWRRTLRLGMSALDAGVSVDCRLFELSRDDVRLAKCFERGRDDHQLAFLFATTRGPLRDLARARKLVERDPTPSLRATIQAETRRPGSGGGVFCRDGAYSTIDTNWCGSEALLRYDYATAPERKRVLDGLDSAGRKRLGRLEKAFLPYDEAESSRVYLANIGGTIRNMLANTSDLVARRDFDVLLARVTAHQKLASASDENLERLAETIKKSEAEQAKEGIPQTLTPYERRAEPEFQRALASSTRTYATYEDAYAAFAAPLLGGGPAAARAVRMVLRRARQRALDGEQ